MEKQPLHYQGHDLMIYTAGNPDNPPIMFVHGYTSSHAVWRQTIPHLQDRYYCVAIDLLGHGASDIPADADYSIQAQGQRVLAVADHLGIERFALVGHSMGGQISLCIASMLAPERVIALVDVSGVTAGKLTAYYEWYIFMIFKYMQVTLPFWEWLYRRYAITVPTIAKIQFGTWFYDKETAFNENFDEWRIAREHALRPNIRRVWVHCMNAIHNLDMTTHLFDIIAPTLVLFGEYDAIVPVSDGHLAHEHIPNSQFVLFDDCGHYPMHEVSADYLDTLDQFFAETYPENLHSENKSVLSLA